MGSVQDGTPEGPKMHSIIVDPRDPKHLYFGMSGGGVHESTDGGRRFTTLIDGMDVVEGFDATNIAVHDPHCLRLCPSNLLKKDFVTPAKAGVQELKTMLSSTSWIPAPGLQHAGAGPAGMTEFDGLVRFQQTASNPDRLYQRNHCGIYRLDRPATQWKRIGENMPKRVGDVGFPIARVPRRCD